MQPDLLPHAPTFDGPDLQPEDHIRLGKQCAAVLWHMRDGEWRTLETIAALAQAPQASVSSRLRDLRKRKFGSWTVERKNLGHGLFVYRVLP
jgi:hypothetical protein